MMSSPIPSSPEAVDPPRAADFPPYPAGWHLFGPSTDLDAGRPVSRDRFGRRVVVWRPAAGAAAVAMDARCWHLGADLGNGCVVDGAVRCPFHHWAFAADGVCRRIPAQAEVPPGVRQRTFAAAERGGFVFVAPTAAPPPFGVPFFEGVAESDLVAAEPFELAVGCPWYLVGANGFDVQHFRAAHDRELVAEPAVDSPSPFARRIVAAFAVTGHGWRDRLTRRLAGPSVQMRVVDWCGGLVFVHARFARTTSYGMVSIRPTGPTETTAHVTVFARRGDGPLPARLAARIKRQFILAFLGPDTEQLAGAVYRPGRLVGADAHLAGYFRWLADASHAAAGGEP